MTVFPWNTSAEEIEGIKPDGIFLSNGPGDPADARPVIELVKKLRGKYPMFGICLGHQIISLAYGARTYKLRFGHRGGNHPVKNLETGKIEITSQNHSYAVDAESLSGTGLEATHFNLLDQTIEGAACREDRVFSVQYHPESAPGPQDSGYPIARVTAKISVGMTLDEIMLVNTPASFEPALDYVVTKMPRFPFDKFTDANQKLGTQMKATGEVMSVGRTFEESLLKAVRSLETGVFHLYMEKFEKEDRNALMDYIRIGTDDRIFAIARLLRLGEPISAIYKQTGIDPWFLSKMKHITDMEQELKTGIGDRELLYQAKKNGFSDRAVGWLWNMTESQVYEMRKKQGIFPVYKMIDTCASEYESYVPYFYSTYEEENESVIENRKKIVVLGSGPIRIGQGVEFDYSTVHAVKTIKEAGYEAIIINNNPETVSTDYTTSDKLYFEPLCVEDVMNVIQMEQPDGVIASLGGQTAINLAKPLEERGVTLIGTGCAAIEKAENRDAFEKLLLELKIPQPKGQAVTDLEEGVQAAEAIGYPVLVRPSFVLGGRAMQIVAKEEQMRHYLKTAVEIDKDKPVLVDKYICGKEVEVDAICDGREIFVPGIMELVERTGVHSGDSISVYPAFSISEKVKETILEYTRKLGLGIGIVGLYNIQFIVDKKEQVYIIEVNPRSSRTVPFLSKATGYPLADMATKVILGENLEKQGITCMYPQEKTRWYVKVPAFSFSKLQGMDAYLSPEMKSTGEAIGYDKKLHRAMYKAMIASGIRVQNYGTVIVTLADEDKEEAVPLIRRFYDMGFNIEATSSTAETLKHHGIRTKVLRKPSEGSREILDAISAGYVSYVINTRAILSGIHYEDGAAIRSAASQNHVTMFTSLDTVRVLLDVLEEITIGVSAITEEENI